MPEAQELAGESKVVAIARVAYRLPCRCLRSILRFDMKVRKIDVAGKAEHAVKVVLDRLKLVGVVDVASELRRRGAVVVERQRRMGIRGVRIRCRAGPAREEETSVLRVGGYHNIRPRRGAFAIDADRSVVRTIHDRINGEIAVRSAPREIGLRLAINLGPDVSFTVLGDRFVECREVGGRVELDPPEFHDVGVLRRVGVGIADGMDRHDADGIRRYAAGEDRAVGDRNARTEPPRKRSCLEGVALHDARPITAIQGRRTVNLPRKTADIITPSRDIASRVGVAYCRRAFDITCKAADQPLMADHVAESETFAHLDARAVEASTESANILVALHKTCRQAAAIGIGTLNITDKSADIIIGRGRDAAEGTTAFIRDGGRGRSTVADESAAAESSIPCFYGDVAARLAACEARSVALGASDKAPEPSSACDDAGSHTIREEGIRAVHTAGETACFIGRSDDARRDTARKRRVRGIHISHEAACGAVVIGVGDVAQGLTVAEQ